MRLNAPKAITWWIAAIAGVLGIVAKFVAIPVLSGVSFWLVVAGLVLLAVATAVKGL